MDYDDISPRPSQTARGLVCALLAVTLCGLWAAGQRFDRAVSQRPVAIHEAPAASTAALNEPVQDFNAPRVAFVDPTAELNARTRSVAADFRRGQYSRVAARLREALHEFPGATAEARQSALSYLGASLKVMGQSADADDALTAAIRLAPDTDEARQARKWLQRPAGRAVETF